MASESQTVADAPSESKPVIDLDAVRQHPLVPLKNIPGVVDTGTEQTESHFEEIRKSVKDFYDTIVANLTEEQLMEMVTSQPSQNPEENIRNILYTAALIRAGVDISKMSVGELTQEEIDAVEHGTKNNAAKNSTHHLLRTSFAKNSLAKLAQAKQSGDAHAEGAISELQRLLSTEKIDDRFWALIGMTSVQFAGKVASINHLRKDDIFVTKLSEEEYTGEWPDARKQAVQKNLNLSEDQMYLLTTYRLHMLSRHHE